MQRLYTIHKKGSAFLQKAQSRKRRPKMISEILMKGWVTYETIYQNRSIAFIVRIFGSGALRVRRDRGARCESYGYIRKNRDHYTKADAERLCRHGRYRGACGNTEGNGCPYSSAYGKTACSYD